MGMGGFEVDLPALQRAAQRLGDLASRLGSERSKTDSSAGIMAGAAGDGIAIKAIELWRDGLVSTLGALEGELQADGRALATNAANYEAADAAATYAGGSAGGH